MPFVFAGLSRSRAACWSVWQTWLAQSLYHPISETISKLAIGEYASIQDLGLAYAIGVFALALGLFLKTNGNWRWRTGLALLIVLGIDILLIAEHNQYAGRPGRGAAIYNGVGAVRTVCRYTLTLKRLWTTLAIVGALVVGPCQATGLC